MSQNILPLKLPPVDNIASNAFLLSALVNYPQTYEWIYSNYIQLVGGIGVGFVSNLPGLTRLNWLDSSMIKRDVVKDWIHDLKAFLTNCIDRNYYVHAQLNERYIPNTRAYQHIDKTHNILIYGYDEDSFYIAGHFYNPPRYSFDHKITFTQLEQAFLHADEAMLVNNWQFELFRISTPLLEKYVKTFDIELVVDSLTRFLQSTPQFPYRLNNRFNDANVYGLQIYEKVILQKLEKPDGPKPVIRDYHTMDNHKSLMLERINFMGERGFLGNHEQHYNAYSEVRKQISIVKNYILKFELTHDQAIMNRVIDIFRDLIPLEKRAVENILESIPGQYHSSKFTY